MNYSMPGFRFSPTSEELVNHYLRKKMLGGYDEELSRTIAEIDVLKFEPWELPKQSVIKTEDREWYFISCRKKKYRNSERADRTTKAGYWKSTGEDGTVRAEHTGEEIATKKKLVYHEGRVPNGVKTNWVIHEYNPTFKFPSQKKDYVAIKLFWKNEDDLPNYEGESSTTTTPVTSDFENQSANEGCNMPTYGNEQFSSLLDSNFNNNTISEDDPSLQAYMASFRHCIEQEDNLDSALWSSMNSCVI